MYITAWQLHPSTACKLCTCLFSHLPVYLPTFLPTHLHSSIHILCLFLNPFLRPLGSRHQPRARLPPRQRAAAASVAPWRRPGRAPSGPKSSSRRCQSDSGERKHKFAVAAVVKIERCKVVHRKEGMTRSSFPNGYILICYNPCCCNPFSMLRQMCSQLGSHDSAAQDFGQGLDGPGSLILSGAPFSATSCAKISQGLGPARPKARDAHWVRT